MTKTFKKIAAAVMAAATLAVGSVGMTASAYSSSVNFHRVPGAPGSDTCTYKKWDFTTSKSTLTMSVSNFTKTDSDTYIYLYATVHDESNPVISDSKRSDGSADAKNMHTGRSAYASAEVKNITGTIYAKVSVNG